MGLFDTVNSAWKSFQNAGQSTDNWLSNNAPGIANWFDPARPFKQQAEGLDKGAADAKALSQLEWERQMEGLSRALQYTGHAQQAITGAYSGPKNTLPQGMSGPRPITGPGLGAYTPQYGK